MPKIERRVPRVIKTTLGSTCAALGDYRIVMHDKKYTCSVSMSGWHRERFLGGKGWTIADDLPSDVEESLKSALGI